MLIVLVPEHLVADARTQVYRYCLNLNFRTEYRIYDDIMCLLHDGVQVRVRVRVRVRMTLTLALTLTLT